MTDEDRAFYATLDHPAFPVDQLEVGQRQQIANVIDAAAGALPRKLVVLAQEGRRFSGRESGRRRPALLRPTHKNVSLGYGLTSRPSTNDYELFRVVGRATNATLMR